MTDSDYQGLMEEPPGGVNHGRTKRSMHSGDDYNATGTHLTLDTTDALVRDLFWSDIGGFNITGDGHGGTRGNPGGATIHPDEYVDADSLRDAVLKEFGFTSEELSRAYTQRVESVTVEDRELRAEMDARMLELRRQGAHMGHFAGALGISRSTVDRAVKRAREAEGS